MRSVSNKELLFHLFYHAIQNTFVRINCMRTIILASLLVVSAGFYSFAPPTVKLALLKYNGGGDWYNDVHSLRNLARFCNQNIGTNISEEYAITEPGSTDIFNYPFVYMTGHGNFVFNNEEAQNMRTYLSGGGFLIINDDYGLDPFVRPALKKVFPESELVELPYSHPIFHQKYSFPNGLPKIHEHDERPARGYGLIYRGRLVCLYETECDLGDGWDDVHNDPDPARNKALQMGANIIQFVFSESEQ